jgi:hypothetical protein
MAGAYLQPIHNLIRLTIAVVFRVEGSSHGSYNVLSPTPKVSQTRQRVRHVNNPQFPEILAAERRLQARRLIAWAGKTFCHDRDMAISSRVLPGAHFAGMSWPKPLRTACLMAAGP